MSLRTIRDLVDNDLDLRVWCYRCARWVIVDSIDALSYFEGKGWEMALRDCRHRFRCKVCRRSDSILVVPASRPKGSIWVDRTLAIVRFGDRWWIDHQRRRKRQPWAETFKP